MTKYKLTLNSNHNVSKDIEFEIPNEEGTYELWFQKEGFGTILVGDVVVDEKENVYNLKLGMSDGSEVDAGTFATPVVEKPITVLTLYQETEITEADQPQYLHYICEGDRPVIKLDGQVLTEYVDYPFASEAKNDKILAVALPVPFSAGTHTLTLEGGTIYFGNYNFTLPMTSNVLEFVSIIFSHKEATSQILGNMVTNITFGSNYGDALGSGALRDLPMSQFKLPEKITKLGRDSLGIGIVTYSDTPKTVWLHNKIEYMDTIIDPTTHSASYTIYLPYGEGDEVLFDPAIMLAKGDNKAQMTYNVYTDNTIIKNGVLSIVDQYTMVNVYHYDGSAWD